MLNRNCWCCRIEKNCLLVDNEFIIYYWVCVWQYQNSPNDFGMSVVMCWKSRKLLFKLDSNLWKLECKVECATACQALCSRAYCQLMIFPSLYNTQPSGFKISVLAWLLSRNLRHFPLCGLEPNWTRQKWVSGGGGGLLWSAGRRAGTARNVIGAGERTQVVPVQ